MYPYIRKLLFQFPAETAHTMVLNTMKIGRCAGLTRLLKPKIASFPSTVMGLTFQNPVGLAAGFDKDGICIDGLGDLGFGFIEVGTVTPQLQVGNAKPRLFRIPEKNAIINRMGFNNKGVDFLVNNVKRCQYQGVIGINIGKNLNTPIEKAADDYLYCLRAVYDVADYITINVSSPNTPGLRDLQFGDALKKLLEAIKQEQQALEKQRGRYVPIAVKLSPDMSHDDIISVASILLSQEVDGVIATNTTVLKEEVEKEPFGTEAGGLSGQPLTVSSTDVIRILASEVSGKIPIIGVGGIHSGQDAAEKIEAGASLVQIYSGFVYKGPALIQEVAEAVYACDSNSSLSEC